MAMSIKKLEEIRKSRKLTQSQVASFLWVSRQTYSKVEKWESDLSLGNAVRLTEILKVGLDDLWYTDTGVTATKTFNRNKYKQIIKNFIKYGSSEPAITKTKLAKLCYLADFARYYIHLESMTNLKYRKMDQWPVPNEYFAMIDILNEEESISITQKGKANLIENISEPESSELSDDELMLIKEIWEKRKYADTQQIVDFTHNQIPWFMSDRMEVIPYSFITQEEPNNVY